MVRRVSSSRFGRIAGACGLLAFFTGTLGWVAGGFAQPGSYSPANDDISDLGAVTASSAWLYNQVGANLTGLLVVVGLAAIFLGLTTVQRGGYSYRRRNPAGTAV